MFEVGQKIVYSTHGICEIKAITVMEIAKEKKEYYALVPVYDAKSTFYVPLDSTQKHNLLRNILTREEIDELIICAGKSKTEWIACDVQRKDFCISAINSGDRGALMRVIEMLYMRQKDLKTQKKHIHISDERYLKTAEKMLHEEFAFVLGIPTEKVPEYIINKIKNAE